MSETLETLEPITRIEKFLAKIGGQDVSIPTPVTREEQYLAKLAGEDVSVPDPVTRKEQFLKEACENGGGGVTITQDDQSGVLTIT